MYAANALPIDSIEHADESQKQQDSESKRVSIISTHSPNPESLFYVIGMVLFNSNALYIVGI